MNKIREERFDILISILKRHEKACHNSNDIDRSLRNVKCFPEYIEVELKTKKILTVNGSFIMLDTWKVFIDDILEIYWITPDRELRSNSRIISKAVLKKEKFDFVYLKTADNTFPIEGMGQSIFPIMKFLKWAIHK